MRSFDQVAVNRRMPQKHSERIAELKFATEPRLYLLDTGENFRGENVAPGNAEARSDLAWTGTLGDGTGEHRPPGATLILPRQGTENAASVNLFGFYQSCGDHATPVPCVAVQKLLSRGHVRVE